jgi:hypothetical protein
MLLSRTIANAFGNALAQMRQTAQPDPTKYPKAKDPSIFNGRRRRLLRTWIGENEICFRTAPNLYRNDTAKVMFAGSFLEGEPKIWFTDYFKDPERIPAFMSDWTLFLMELQRNFGLEDELGAAKEDLRKLSMTDRDHASHFSARFRSIVANLDGSWDDRNLRNMYYQRMAPRLRAQFVSAGKLVPGKLEPLIEITELFDRVYWADFELNRSVSHPTVSGSSEAPKDKRTAVASKPVVKATVPRTTPAKPDSSHLTKEGKLTEVERKRRFDTGACLYCGELGHIASACPKRTLARARGVAPTESAPPTPSDPALSPPVRQTARASITVLPEGSDQSGNE